jgi:hypothetical protein
LSVIASVVGIITAIPIFWTWYEVTFGRTRRHKAQLQQIMQAPGSRPAILIVDLLPGKDVKAQVMNYVKSRPELAGIPAERTFHIGTEKPMSPEEVPAFVDRLRTVSADIVRAGTDCVHLFYAGPIVAMAHVGVEFKRGCKVLLYHHEHGTYVPWSPLELPWR